ncbi:hypothetical protein, partial [Streptomyces sp. NPDC056670]|uniref:hypothetical protein n=1 Tax=Streptomyces sp. NPDC056670 TaxID=3345904 RepID=UPI0036BE0A46
LVLTEEGLKQAQRLAAVSAPQSAEESAPAPVAPSPAAVPVVAPLEPVTDEFASLHAAVDFLARLKVGDRVRITREGRTADYGVTMPARRSGSQSTVKVTVSLGPGRYAFEVSAGDLFANLTGDKSTWSQGGTKMMRVPVAPAPVDAERESASAMGDRFAVAQGAQERPAAPAGGSGPFAGAVAAQNAGERSVILARLDAVWSKGYVTGPPMTHGEKRVAAEIIADHYTKGGTVTVHGRDRATLVAEYAIKSNYDVMNAYGSARMVTGGDVWALVARNRSGERVESLMEVARPHVRGDRFSVAVTAGGSAESEPFTEDASWVVVTLGRELSAGGTLHRHASGVLRLTRENGVRLLLRTV